MKEPETQEIECAKCGGKMRVHIPSIAMAHDAKMSQASIIPSWSLSERQCQNCGAINYPMIMSINTGWVAIDPPAEERQVKPASMEEVARLRAIGGRG